MSAPVLRAPRPLKVTGPDGPWGGVLRELERHGVAVVHAEQSQWRAQRPAGAELRALLGKDLRRYESLVNDDLRGRFVASRMLLKHVGAAVLGTAPAELELGYGLNGRLYLRGCDQVDISLSHTRDVLLVGITSVGTIGVDVEHAARGLYGRNVEDLMCTAHEKLRLAELPESERNTRLLRLWTLKEAYSKALGQGLLFPFTEFGFDTGGPGEARLQRVDGTAVGDRTWRYFSFPLAGHFVGAMALQDNGRALRPDTKAGTALDRGLVDVIQDALSARSWSDPV